MSKSFVKHMLGDYEPTTFTLGDAYSVPEKGWTVYTYSVDPPRPAGQLRAMKGKMFPAPGGERPIEAVEAYAVSDTTNVSKIGLAGMSKSPHQETEELKERAIELLNADAPIEVTASVTLPTILKTGGLHTTSAVLHNGKRVEAGTEIEVKDGDTLQFIDLKPDQEVVSAWDPRTWIAPEKSVNAPLKRIDKIAKY